MRLDKLVQAEHLPLAEIRQRPMAVPVPPAHARKARANQAAARRPIAFGRDERLGGNLLGRIAPPLRRRSRCTNRNCRTIRTPSPPPLARALGRQIAQQRRLAQDARASCSRDTAARRARESPASAASDRAAPASESRAASRGRRRTPSPSAASATARPARRRFRPAPSCTVPVCSSSRGTSCRNTRVVPSSSRVSVAVRSTSLGPADCRTSGSREFCQS